MSKSLKPYTHWLQEVEGIVTTHILESQSHYNVKTLYNWIRAFLISGTGQKRYLISGTGRVKMPNLRDGTG